MRVGDDAAIFVSYGRSGVGEIILHVRCSCKIKCGHVLSSRVRLAKCECILSYYDVTVSALRDDLSASRPAVLVIRGQICDRVWLLRRPRTPVRDYRRTAMILVSRRGSRRRRGKIIAQIT
jgi:hypothetical protein